MLTAIFHLTLPPFTWTATQSDSSFLEKVIANPRLSAKRSVQASRFGLKASSLGCGAGSFLALKSRLFSSRSSAHARGQPFLFQAFCSLLPAAPH